MLWKIKDIPIRGILENKLVICDIGKETLLHKFVHQHYGMLSSLAFSLVGNKPIYNRKDSLNIEYKEERWEGGEV